MIPRFFWDVPSSAWIYTGIVRLRCSAVKSKIGWPGSKPRNRSQNVSNTSKPCGTIKSSLLFRDRQEIIFRNVSTGCCQPIFTKVSLMSAVRPAASKSANTRLACPVFLRWSILFSKAPDSASLEWNSWHTAEAMLHISASVTWFPSWCFWKRCSSLGSGHFFQSTMASQRKK